MKAAVKKELKNLEKVAVRQGYLTYDQLEDTLSLDMADPVALVDAIDDAFLKLGELKIEVFDSEEDALRKIQALRRPEAQKEAAKQALAEQAEQQQQHQNEYQEPDKQRYRRQAHVRALSRRPFRFALSDAFGRHWRQRYPTPFDGATLFFCDCGTALGNDQDQLGPVRPDSEMQPVHAVAGIGRYLEVQQVILL